MKRVLRYLSLVVAGFLLALGGCVKDPAIEPGPRVPKTETKTPVWDDVLWQTLLKDTTFLSLMSLTDPDQESIETGLLRDQYPDDSTFLSAWREYFRSRTRDAMDCSMKLFARYPNYSTLYIKRVRGVDSRGVCYSGGVYTYIELVGYSKTYYIIEEIFWWCEIIDYGFNSMRGNPKFPCITMNDQEMYVCNAIYASSVKYHQRFGSPPWSLWAHLHFYQMENDMAHYGGDILAMAGIGYFPYELYDILNQISWVIHDSYSDMICDPEGFYEQGLDWMWGNCDGRGNSPSIPGGGGGGGDPAPDPKPDPPKPEPDPEPRVEEVDCDEQAEANTNQVIDVLGKFFDAGLQGFIDKYKNDKDEHAMSLNYNTATGKYVLSSVLTLGLPNQTEIPFANRPELYSVATIHNHPPGYAFSETDILDLAKRNGVRQNYTTSFVVTPDGTFYALQVEDPRKAAAFFQAHNGNKVNLSSDLDAMIKEIRGYCSFEMTFPVEYEHAVALFLDKYDTGIKLSRRGSNGFRQKSTTRNSNGILTFKTCK